MIYRFHSGSQIITNQDLMTVDLAWSSAAAFAQVRREFICELELAREELSTLRAHVGALSVGTQQQTLPGWRPRRNELLKSDIPICDRRRIS